MTEYIPPGSDVFKEAYKPNTQTVTLELHRLLSIFLSSKSFAELRTGTGEEFDSIAEIQQHEGDEITRILLAVAITARVIDDRQNKVFDAISESCGTLVDVVATPGEESPLSLREACNKIIHAQKIRFDLSETDAHQTYLNPLIYLYGQRQNGAEWKATLNVIEFAKEYVSCIQIF